MGPSKTTALIALGGNMPDGAIAMGETLRSALAMMPEEGLILQGVSPFYATRAVPEGSGPDFVNAAAQVMTEMTPRQILEALHRIEDQFGRRRDARWGPRVLDLDLIAVEGEVRPDAETQTAWRDLPPQVQATRAPDRLILPHPRLQDRAFVLVPLADVAPDWRHPLLGSSVVEMLACLPSGDRDGVRPLDAPDDR